MYFSPDKYMRLPIVTSVCMTECRSIGHLDTVQAVQVQLKLCTYVPSAKAVVSHFRYLNSTMHDVGSGYPDACVLDCRYVRRRPMLTT